jgi:hypothetical protein
LRWNPVRESIPICAWLPEPVRHAHRHHQLQTEAGAAESEVRIARQKAIIEEMVQHNHPTAAATARHVLAVMEETLRLLRRHIEIVRRPSD